MQKRIHSMMETVLSTLIGYGVAVATQILVFPLFDIHVSLETNLAIGYLFTLVSIIRGYAVRRLFNWLHTEGILKC